MNDYNKRMRDLLLGRDTGVTPGQMLSIILDAEQISRRKLAQRMLLSTKELTEIENGIRPFPTLLLFMIFFYGLPAWMNDVCE